ncbi:hypothetical protein LTS10_011272 [Elasticomyces elasticus]|nr:hypothetical protein LTS10_011272 [Elasticomyces elasticus]
MKIFSKLSLTVVAHRKARLIRYQLQRLRREHKDVGRELDDLKVARLALQLEQPRERRRIEVHERDMKIEQLQPEFQRLTEAISDLESQNSKTVMALRQCADRVYDLEPHVSNDVFRPDAVLPMPPALLAMLRISKAGSWMLQDYRAKEQEAESKVRASLELLNSGKDLVQLYIDAAAHEAGIPSLHLPGAMKGLQREIESHRIALRHRDLAKAMAERRDLEQLLHEDETFPDVVAPVLEADGRLEPDRLRTSPLDLNESGERFIYIDDPASRLTDAQLDGLKRRARGLRDELKRRRGIAKRMQQQLRSYEITAPTADHIDIRLPEDVLVAEEMVLECEEAARQLEQAVGEASDIPREYDFRTHVVDGRDGSEEPKAQEDRLKSIDPLAIEIWKGGIVNPSTGRSSSAPSPTPSDHWEGRPIPEQRTFADSISMSLISHDEAKVRIRQLENENSKLRADAQLQRDQYQERNGNDTCGHQAHLEVLSGSRPASREQALAVLDLLPPHEIQEYLYDRMQNIKQADLDTAQDREERGLHARSYSLPFAHLRMLKGESAIGGLSPVRLRQLQLTMQPMWTAIHNELQQVLREDGWVDKPEQNKIMVGDIFWAWVCQRQKDDSIEDNDHRQIIGQGGKMIYKMYPQLCIDTYRDGIESLRLMTRSLRGTDRLPHFVLEDTRSIVKQSGYAPSDDGSLEVYGSYQFDANPFVSIKTKFGDHYDTKDFMFPIHGCLTNEAAKRLATDLEQGRKVKYNKLRYLPSLSQRAARPDFMDLPRSKPLYALMEDIYTPEPLRRLFRSTDRRPTHVPAAAEDSVLPANDDPGDILASENLNTTNSGVKRYMVSNAKYMSDDLKTMESKATEGVSQLDTTSRYGIDCLFQKSHDTFADVTSGSSSRSSFGTSKDSSEQTTQSAPSPDIAVMSDRDSVLNAKVDPDKALQTGVTAECCKATIGIEQGESEDSGLEAATSSGPAGRDSLVQNWMEPSTGTKRPAEDPSPASTSVKKRRI